MAKGSHATYGGWEPRICGICGKRIVLSGKDALQFEYDHHTKTGYAWHVRCLSSRA